MIENIYQLNKFLGKLDVSLNYKQYFHVFLS